MSECSNSYSPTGRVKKVLFTEEMKSTHTILVPDMLPIHFEMIVSVFRMYGYKMEVLKNSGRAVVDEGLKNVHNDTCYPALLVIGQFLDALNSGKYDPDKTALMLSQTGGGCRASNYISLLRKALAEKYPNIPVLSLNFSGLEKDASMKITAPIALKLIYAVIYGDLLMLLYNQCKPYEAVENETDKLLKEWEDKLNDNLRKNKFMNTSKTYKAVLEDFAKIERKKIKKPKVGIVGEIYVKYSPLANNDLEKFLIKEGCEPVVPGLMDFLLYCTVCNFNDGKLYGYKSKGTIFNKIGYKVLYNRQKQMINIIKKHGIFEAPHDFEHLRKEADKYISQGVTMGEGWLITAEMAALAQTGTENIICAQPFGCLPNHIVAKGMSRVIKDAFPQANIVAIDYDPGATQVNQENRIKLMLANAIRE